MLSSLAMWIAQLVFWLRQQSHDCSIWPISLQEDSCCRTAHRELSKQSVTFEVQKSFAVSNQLRKWGFFTPTTTRYVWVTALSVRHKWVMCYQPYRELWATSLSQTMTKQLGLWSCWLITFGEFKASVAKSRAILLKTGELNVSGTLISHTLTSFINSCTHLSTIPTLERLGTLVLC